MFFFVALAMIIKYGRESARIRAVEYEAREYVNTLLDSVVNPIPAVPFG